MLERMIGAARLDVHTYEEVEHDENATRQAMLVVIIVAVAGAIGGLGLGSNIIVGLVFGIIFAITSWAVWAFITFWIGTTILKTPQTHATWGQLARCTGFAQTPLVLQVFAFIPGVGGVVVIIANIWRLAAMVVAVRQALDYESTWRAVGVVLIGFIIVVIPLLIIAGLFIQPETASSLGGQ